MNLLIVEDNEAEKLIMQEAFKQFTHSCRLFFAKDGVEALEVLHRQNKFSELPEIDLVLLDLNLPRKNGHETLAEIKSHARLKFIPVIILTGACSPHELAACYESGASFCLNKPANFAEHISLVKSLVDFVSTKVIFPPASMRQPQNSFPA